MMLTLISVITIIIYFLFFLKNQRLSILGVILLLPTYLIKLNILSIPTTFLELILIGIFIGFLYKLLKDRNDIKLYGFFIPIIIFLVAAIISTKISNHSIPALGILKAYIIEPILFFIVFINTFKTKKELEIVIKTLGITVIYLSVYAIFQKITGIGIGTDDPSWAIEKTRRVTSVFSYPNALGLYLAPIVTIFLFKIINKPKNIFNIIVFVLGLLAIIFARSSGALMGVVASIFLYLFIISKDKLRSFIIGFIGFILILTSPLTYSFVNKNLLLGDFSGKIRVQMWEETSSMLREHFISGGGLNNFKDALKPYHKQTFFELYLYPHNIILNTWSELGFFGLLSFVIIIIIFYTKNKNNYNYSLNIFWQDNADDKNIKILKHKKEIALILSLSMFTLLIHGLVDVPFFKNDLAILFWIIIGLAVVNEKIDDNIIIIKK